MDKKENILGKNNSNDNNGEGEEQDDNCNINNLFMHMFIYIYTWYNESKQEKIIKSENITMMIILE